MSIIDLENKLKVWVPNFDENDKKDLNNIIFFNNNSLGNLFLNKYTDILFDYKNVLNINKDLDIEKDGDFLSSGFVFFYASLIFIMHYNDYQSKIRAIFLYDMLYICIDNFIDNVNDKLLKKIFITNCRNILNEKYIKTDNEMINTIQDTYKELISICPNIKLDLIEIFNAEINGVDIQNNDKLNEKDYYNIGCLKGGLTVKILHKIIDNTINLELEQASYEIGIIMQFIDDMIDVNDDIKNNINTIATYQYIKYGNIDKLYIETANRIININKKYTIFIMLYCIFLFYILYINPNNFSDNIKTKFNKYNLFEFNGSKILNKALFDNLINKYKS